MNGRWMFDVTRAAAARAGGGEGGRGGNRAADILLRMSHQESADKGSIIPFQFDPPPSGGSQRTAAYPHSGWGAHSQRLPGEVYSGGFHTPERAYPQKKSI